MVWITQVIFYGLCWLPCNGRQMLRPRILIYTAILCAITAAAAWSIATRLPLTVDVIRDRAAIAREVENERVEKAVFIMP